VQQGACQILNTFYASKNLLTQKRESAFRKKDGTLPAEHILIMVI